MRLYLDANPIVYSIEGVPEFRLAAINWIERVEAAAGVVITSRLSRLECRVKPLRDGNRDLLEAFEGFFVRENLELVEVTAEVIDTATQLRHPRVSRGCAHREWKTKEAPEGAP